MFNNKKSKFQFLSTLKDGVTLKQVIWIMKKILFNDKYGLTQAVLEGRKTQTRRIISKKTLDKIGLFQKEYYEGTFDKLEGVELLTHYFITEKLGKLPHNIGKVVAVAQSYRDCGGINKDGRPNWDVIAEAKGASNAGWDNKMFVRADLMPHQIRITSVHIERLQDISDEDCIKEGVRKVVNENGIYVQYYVGKGDIAYSFENPREAFANLINKVSRKDVWEENPYVFVYDFEVIK